MSYYSSVLDKAFLRLYYSTRLFLKGAGANKLLTIKPLNSPNKIHLRGNTSDIGVFYQVFYSKDYEIPLAFEPKIIVDCGANVGLATVYFKNRYPNAKIIAVEPEPSNFEMLQRNTQQVNDVHCLNMGIWNKSANLIVEGHENGLWSCTVREVKEETKDSIKAISIDGLMAMYGIDSIDLLKIDIEGSEKELFEINFEQWLPKVRVIIVELHDRMKPGAARSVFSALSNYDFVLSTKGENFIFTMK